MVLRPCFTAPGFATFCGLAAGLCGQVRRRTVVGMLLGGCLQHAWPHDRAHYFFARARWELDQLGLAVAQLVVLLVVPPGADLEVAVDDSVFRRAGRKVHGAGWQHDGSSPSLNKLSYGNCFVTAGIVVKLPFCTRAVCLPVLARLHLPGKKKGEGPSKVDTAAALVSQLALAFPGRIIHVVADAAYHGPALRTLPGNVTWTCRIPANAVLYDLAPPPPARWWPATPPGGRSSRRSPTPATYWAPARPATGSGAPSSAPSRSPCSCTPWSSCGTPGTAMTRLTSMTAAPPSPGTAPRPSRPSRTCSSSFAGS